MLVSQIDSSVSKGRLITAPGSPGLLHSHAKNKNLFVCPLPTYSPKMGPNQKILLPFHKIFMPPTLKKLEGHIAFGLSVCVCVRVYVC